MSSAPSASAVRVMAITSSTGVVAGREVDDGGHTDTRPSEQLDTAGDVLGPDAHRCGAVFAGAPTQLVDAVGRVVVGQVGEIDQPDRTSGTLNAVHTSKVADDGSNSIRGMLPVSRRNWRSAGVSASTAAT